MEKLVRGHNDNEGADGTGSGREFGKTIDRADSKEKEAIMKE